MNLGTSQREGDQHTKDHSRVRLLSILLEKRRLGWWMLGGGVIYFLLSLAKIQIFFCPVRKLTDLRCPGCGLTSGSKALVKGDWHAAIQQNWFTPIFALFWLAVGIGLILPEPARGKYLLGVRKSEELTQWPLVLGVTLFIYALTRNIGWV